MSSACPTCDAPAQVGPFCVKCGAEIPSEDTAGASAWDSIEITRNDEPETPTPDRRLRSPGGHTASLPGRASRAANSRSSQDILDLGMVDLGGGASGLPQLLPSLDLISLRPPVSSEPEPEAPPAEAEPTVVQPAPEDTGAYGKRPRKFYEEVPYFVRVMLIKRQLDTGLASVTAHRKRLDQQAEEAMVALGEAIFEQQHEPALGELKQQFRVVNAAHKQVGAQEAVGQKATEQHGLQLEKLAADIEKLEQQLVPLRAREAEVLAKADKFKAYIKRKEAAIQKLDGELKGLAVAPATAGERLAACEAERAELVADVQTRTAQMAPIQAALEAQRKEITKRTDAVAAMRGEQRRHTQAAVRDAARHRVSAGGARSAYKDALKSLAVATLKANLEVFAPDAAKAAQEALERAAEKREAEAEQRAAAYGYDHAAYLRGMYTLVGGTAFVFLVFAAMIVF